MKVMILAAGKGERMLPLTKNTPKPMLEVDGKPLIKHLVERLATNGFTDIVINYSYLGEQIEAVLGHGESLGLNIQYSVEEEPLETAGGIIKALPLLGCDAFALVNADIWTDYSFKNLPILNGNKNLAHLVMVKNADHHPKGDFVFKRDDLLSLPQDEKAQTYTYSGIAVYHPDFFAGFDEGRRPLSPLIESAMEDERVSGEYFQGKWVDVGTPERLQALQQLG